MHNKDNLSSHDALIFLPLADVLYPLDQGLEHLTRLTRRAVSQNMQNFLQSIEQDDPDLFELRRNLMVEIDNVDQHIPPGGLSFSQEELEYVYQEMGRGTYKDLLYSLNTKIIPGYFSHYKKSRGRNPGLVSTGFIIDTLRIIRPDIASFEDGVALYAKIINTSSLFPPFILGASLDDAIKMKGSPSAPLDFFVDPEASKLFDKLFRKHAPVKTLEEYEYGFSMTIEEMQMRATGFSTN